MHRVRLIHWDEDEGLERQKQLEALGFEAQFDFGGGSILLRELRAGVPDALVIDMTRLPSHGREIGRTVRMTKVSRHLPLIFVEGDASKISDTKALLPDATYTTWRRVKTAIERAIARPPQTPVVPKDIMSAKPAVAKLGMKDGFKVSVLGSPKGFADTLKPLPRQVTFTAKPDKSSDLVLCFVRTAHELHAQVLALHDTVDRQTLWLLWPKKASRVKSELNGNIVREAGLAAGWVDYKVCAVDDTWSGLAFKRRK